MTSKRITLFGILLLTFGAVYGSVFLKLIDDWSSDENYSHGFLVVPLALYVVWDRRRQLRSTVPSPSMVGLLVVVVSAILLTVGVLGAEHFTMRVSMLGVLAGSVLYLGGWAFLRILIFPIAFLLLMIPLPAIVFNQVTLPLQLLASTFGEWVLFSAGVPVLREGNIIQLPNTTLAVAEACSGIRSLITLLMLGIVFGYFMDMRGGVRVGFALITVPIAITTNGLRVAATGFAAYRYGPEAAEGFFHQFSGWLVFMTSALLLFVAYRAFAWQLRRRTASQIPVEPAVSRLA